MISSNILRVLSAATVLRSGVNALIDPTEIYNGGYNSTSNNTALRIATGGAGQSGLVKGAAYESSTSLSAD